MAILVKKNNSEDASLLAHVLRVADLALEKKATEIKAYDMRGLTLITDAFVNCTANSEPQMKAIMNSIRNGMVEVGVKANHVEGDSTGGWILLDFSDVIVHIFRKESREFYDLDGMWGDAKEIALDLDE